MADEAERPPDGGTEQLSSNVDAGERRGADGGTPLLEARDIHKHFGRVYALRGTNFAVYPHEVVALIGDNGAGKSTLIKILAGVLARDSGEIFVEGHPAEINSAVAARRYGIETVEDRRPPGTSALVHLPRTEPSACRFRTLALVSAVQASARSQCHECMRLRLYGRTLGIAQRHERDSELRRCW